MAQSEADLDLRAHFHRPAVQQRGPVNPVLYGVGCRFFQGLRTTHIFEILHFPFFADHRLESHGALNSHLSRQRRINGVYLPKQHGALQFAAHLNTL